MLVNFGSKSGKKEVFFSILIEDPLMRELEGSTGISKEDKEAPSIFKRIVLDSHQYIGEDQKDIHITVTGLDDNNVCYTIAEEDEEVVHKIALKCLNIQEAIDGVADHRIVTVAQLIKKVGAESVLEHFAEIRRRSPGIFSRMMDTIGQFFSWLLLRFRFIEFLWEAITHDSEKKEARMRWDLDLLSATCGVSPDRELSVTDSLDYMSQMLKREETAPVDPAVSKRVSEGADLGKHLNQLRKNFSRKRFKKVRSRVCEKAAKLGEGEKMLLPISYLKKGNSVQMLMEIGMGEMGKYTVALISHSEETRELFDRELGLETSQSPRREIENVELNDLLAMLSVVLELDTSPQCRSEVPTSDWESVFMQALKMPDTHVKSVEMTSSYEGGLSSSHVGETLDYLARQQKTPEEAKRFELAARLRIFLDLTGRGEKQFKDSRYWRLVRTSAHQLARMIESNKNLIGDAESRPIELARIFSELQQMLDNLDTHLPELVNLRKQVAPRLSGLIEAKGEPPPPPLENVEKKRNVYPKVHPAFEPLNSEDPVQSIIGWGHRIRALIELGEINLASNETPLMARMLPKPEELPDLSREQLKNMLDGLNALTEAIARSVVSEENSSIYMRATVEALHCYSVSLIQDNPEFSEVREIYPHIRSLEELLKTRMPPADRVWLEGIAKKVRYREREPYIHFRCSRDFLAAPKHLLQPVFNIVHLARIARGELTVSKMPQEAVNFSFTPAEDGISTSPEMVLTTEPDSEIPLSLKPPPYAQVVGEELTNRYTSEFCCLGCIRDNCPNYNRVDKKNMRFHPLFMLHNYVDIFCEDLIKSCHLHRDEAIDLLYTQQTNQNAREIWEYAHSMHHATKAATGFDSEDHRIQAINTLNIFLENPHFFRHPELCWQFETRLFTSNAFLELVKSSDAFFEHQPFLMGALRRLNREISVSYAGGDIATAAYLLHTSERIKAMIKNSDTIHETEKSALLGLFKHDADTLLLTWGGELVGKEDEKAQEDMRMVLPLLAGRFHTRFIDSSGKDPCFLDKKILQTLFLSLARIENLQKGKKKIDPEIYVRYKGLAAALVPQVEKVIEEESSKGDFINSILAVLYPGIAAKRLEWDTAELPTVQALDPVTKELYAYDLTTGQLTLQEKSRVELPPFLRINPDVKPLFGHAVESEWQTRRTPVDDEGEKVDEYIHPDFPDLRILVKFPIRKEGEEAIPKRRVVIERKIKISSRKHAWMSYKRFNEQNSVVNAGKRSETPDIPCIAAQLIGDRQCWVDRDGKKSTCWISKQGTRTQSSQ